MQQKWVELFEKVIGRKPTPAEFMAGKESGFDLKQIQSIAGKDLEATQVFSASQVQMNLLQPRAKTLNT